MATSDDEDEPQHVVDMPGTDSYHKSHPSSLLSPACDPTARGNLCRESAASGSRCQHEACFGGDDA